jgi:hypothetical protein
MGHIRTEPIDSRNGNSFNFFDVDVGATFKTGALFTARGFSYSTIKALVRAGIDAPERLLFVDGADLLLISGLDEQAFREIARYRRAAREPSPTFPRPPPRRDRSAPRPGALV